MVGGTVVGAAAGAARTRPLSVSTASGGGGGARPGATPIVRAAYRPISANAGAATVAAYGDVVGSSITTIIDSLGSSAGRKPAKVEM